MKFAIITATHNRYHLLKRTITSVLNQTYDNFEYIIIDDSTNDETLNSIHKDFTDSRIKYFKNDKNKGFNYTLNRGINNISDNIDFFVFLDDDDFFDINALEVANKNILQYSQYNWYISNRKKITKIEEYCMPYDYFSDYFGGNKISGDATHFIRRSIVGNIRFSKFLKQEGQWIFYTQLGEYNKMFAYDYDSTICEYLETGMSITTKGKGRLYEQLLYFLGILEFILLGSNSLQYKKYVLKKIIQWRLGEYIK